MVRKLTPLSLILEVCGRCSVFVGVRWITVIELQELSVSHIVYL